MDEQQIKSIQTQSKMVSRSCVNASLRRATRATTQLYDQILAPSGIQITQFTLLVACAIAGPAPISTLADVLVMDRTTLARNLELLKARSLVKVAPGSDQRVRLVTLSEKGFETLAVALPLWQVAQTQITEGFGQEPLDDLLDHLSRMVEVTRKG